MQLPKLVEELKIRLNSIHQRTARGVSSVEEYPYLTYWDGYEELSNGFGHSTRCMLCDDEGGLDKVGFMLVVGFKQFTSGLARLMYGQCIR